MFPRNFFLLLCLFFLFSSCTPFTPQLPSGEFVAPLDQLNIHYSVKGSGPVMLAGHLNSGKIGYELTLTELEQHFTMVYYDPRGTGASDAPLRLEDYEYAHLVEEIELLRQHLGQEKIWLFGHSDQSEIALEYAIDFPGHVQGLLLSGTHFVAEESTEKEEKRKFEAYRKKSPWFSQVIADCAYRMQYGNNIDASGRDLQYAPLKWWCSDSLSASKVIPIFDAISAAGRRKPIRNKYPFSTPAQREAMVKRIKSYQSNYAVLSIPVLILNGEHDTNNPPKLVQKLQQEIPNSTLHFVKNAGHFPWVEQSDSSFNLIFDWLASNK